jgi:hypothetical protein
MNAENLGDGAPERNETVYIACNLRTDLISVRKRRVMST